MLHTMANSNALSSPFTNFPGEGALPNLDKTYVIIFSLGFYCCIYIVEFLFRK